MTSQIIYIGYIYNQDLKTLNDGLTLSVLSIMQIEMSCSMDQC